MSETWRPTGIYSIPSPLDRIDTDFSGYVDEREGERSCHLIDGVPDYAFGIDTQLARRLGAIPHFEGICDKAVQILINQDVAALRHNGLRTGPKQYPEIDRMVIDCARVLHIAPPSMYILNNPTLNAAAYGMDNGEGVVTVFTGLIDRMTPSQLKAIIGHECGHLMNSHVRYRSVAGILGNGGGGLIRGIGSLIFTAANAVLMNGWSRACEITADRAAMICADTPEDAIDAIERLMAGTINENYSIELDTDEIRRQLDEVESSNRFTELLSTHPIGLRRILCMKEFAESDMLLKWRPDLRRPGQRVRPFAEVEERCKRLAGVLDRKD